MAEETEQHEKTEEPTPRKLEEARKKGNVATSREVNHWFLILAATIALMIFVPGMFESIGAALSKVIAAAGTPASEDLAIMPVVRQMLIDIGIALAPLVILLLVAALGSGLSQNGFMFTAETIVPKLEKISIFKGVKRLFSVKSLVEFAKGILKIAIVGTVVILVLVPSLSSLDTTVSLVMPELLQLLRSTAMRVLIAVLAVMTVITVLDVLYQRMEHTKKLRMSRQEIKDELKQTEGDPHIKAKLRQIRMERARQRMMAKVPDADVVITNPTHYSVALEYDSDTMAAPRMVAKGIDALALRIREVAEEHDVPIVENPPLARALYATVELEQEVPPEHYRAVAEVISYVMGLKAKPGRA
ncbi:MAG: flagellar biosynthesis protein FlhB [Alphaproteobacteria bacterium]|nr:flagellar biosynthesis protein FlhB [Alphaproteobacteria bacterium]